MDSLQIIVDVIMALVFALMVFLGIKRGFVKSFFKSTKIFFVIIVTILIGSLVVSLCQNLFVNGMFEGKISSILVEKAQESGESFDFASIKDGIPAILRNIVPMDELEQHFSTLSGSSVDVARAMGEKIEALVIDVVSNVIGYILAFVISFILCTIVIFIIEKIWELPVLGWINTLGGVIWGLASAYLTTSILALAVAFIFGDSFVDGTVLTKILYNIGLFSF